MADQLRSWKDGKAAGLLWVDYDDYARAVFAGSPADWRQNATTFAATICQAYKVLPSAVIAVDVVTPFVEAAAGQGVSVNDLFAAAAPTAFVSTILDAIADRLGRSADLVLRLPSPHSLLVALGASAAGDEPDPDDLDDAGMALTDLMRTLSTKPVNGVQIIFAHPSEADLDACDSILGTARHYGWLTAAVAPGASEPGILSDLKVDLLLLPDAPAAVLDGSPKLGGGLSDGFWRGAAPAPKAALRYGRVPPDAPPEGVIERMRGLTGP